MRVALERNERGATHAVLVAEFDDARVFKLFEGVMGD